jgi:hypothetical protein
MVDALVTFSHHDDVEQISAGMFVFIGEVITRRTLQYDMEQITETVASKELHRGPSREVSHENNYR